jgi:DNA-binding transcriptional ArsR family regulator
VSQPEPAVPRPAVPDPAVPAPAATAPAVPGPAVPGPAAAEPGAPASALATGGLPGGHPTAGIDDTVHQRHRLGILTITAEAQRADFGQLRAALGLTAGNLSRHLAVLEEAELVQVEKGYEGRRPRTWVRITSRGRKALAAELATLTELVRRHSGAGG